MPQIERIEWFVRIIFHFSYEHIENRNAHYWKIEWFQWPKATNERRHGMYIPNVCATLKVFSMKKKKQKSHHGNDNKFHLDTWCWSIIPSDWLRYLSKFKINIQRFTLFIAIMICRTCDTKHFIDSFNKINLNRLKVNLFVLPKINNVQFRQKPRFLALIKW